MHFKIAMNIIKMLENGRSDCEVSDLRVSEGLCHCCIWGLEAYPNTTALIKPSVYM